MTSADEISLVDKSRFECGAELNIPPSELDKYNGSDFPEGSLGHCYIKCFFEKLGIFDEKTGFKTEVLYDKLSMFGTSDSLRNALEDCSKEANKETNACERAYRGIVCFKNHK